MIYFDNAATGGFKAAAVTEAAVTAVKYLCANPGRSGHRLSITGAKTVLAARMSLAKLFNAEDSDRVIFTKNATEALNLALQGTARRNGHIVTTIYEHNSVWRTLTYLKEEYGIRVSVTDGTPESIAAALTDETYLVMVNHVSNVTGREADLPAIGNVLKKTGVLFACDCSQSAGHVPIDMKKCGIRILCAAGHKGMGGIMGSGFLIFDGDTEIRPVLFGGTGTESLNTSQPTFYPDRLESGTLNLPAIAALGEAAEYVRPNLKIFGETLYTLTDALIGELKHLPFVRIYSEPNRFGIVSFAAKIPSAELADILSSRYDIAVRGGLHCAPVIHKHLGTERDGLVRVSFAPQNSLREISALIKALGQILQGGAPV